MPVPRQGSLAWEQHSPQAVMCNLILPVLQLDTAVQTLRGLITWVRLALAGTLIRLD